MKKSRQTSDVSSENTVNSSKSKARINMPDERPRFRRDRARILQEHAFAVNAGGSGYDAPASVLRRAIYRQGMRYLDAGRLPVLKRYVNKDLAGGTRPWSDSENVFYWVVRLLSSAGKVPTFLAPSTWTKMESDLALAAAFEIHSIYVDHFLAFAGGKAGRRILEPAFIFSPPAWVPGITRTKQGR